MEENFRRVPPPPPRPFIPRPPVGQEGQSNVEEVKASSVIDNTRVETSLAEKQESITQVEEKKQKKEMNPKVKLSLLIAGSAVCFIGAIVCGVLLIV